MKKIFAITVAVITLSSCGGIRILQNDISTMQTRIDNLEKQNTELLEIAERQAAEIDSLAIAIRNSQETYAKFSEQISTMNAIVAFLTSRDASPEDFEITGPSGKGSIYDANHLKPSAPKKKPQPKKSVDQNVLQDFTAKILDPDKCQATNQSGNQCQLPPMPGSKFCIQHQHL